MTTTALERPRPHNKKKLSLVDWIAQGVTAVEKRLGDELGPQIEGEHTAAQLAHTYATLRLIKERWDTVGDLLDAWRERLSKEVVPAAFEAEHLKSFTTDSGYRVTVSDALYASIKKDMREQAFIWLRKNKLGELIIETVNSGTLSAAARHRIEEEGKDLPEALFSVATVHNTSFTKLKNPKLGE